MKNREYYTEFAWVLPKDTKTLTAGCAKYRYDKLNFFSICYSHSSGNSSLYLSIFD